MKLLDRKGVGTRQDKGNMSASIKKEKLESKLPF